MYNGTQVSADATVAMGSVAGALITTTGSSFEMAVGLSYVSVANARNNL